jgi:sugar lactone lactonase YvrE
MQRIAVLIDGRKIAFSRHGSIFVVEPAARRLRRIARGLNAVGLAWSPDGRRLAVRTFHDGLRTVALDGFRVRSLVSEDLGELFSFGHRGVDWQPLRR